MSLYSSDNPVFACFSFYAALLGAKTLSMAFLTAKQRFAKKAFANPEDVKGKADFKIKTDEDVERVRRAHMNDLENILPFLALGLLYVGTGPSFSWARTLFRVFTGARFVHTLVYAVYVVPQPARALSWSVGMMVNLYLAFAVASKYASSM